MSSEEQPETQQIVAEEPSTAIVLKDTTLVRDVDAPPKPDPRGHVCKAVEVQSLCVGGVVVSGKIMLSMDNITEEQLVAGLVDGSGASVNLRFQPGCKAKVHAEGIYFAGPIKADGFSGNAVTVCKDKGVSLVGVATSAVHNGRARIFKDGEVYSGQVRNSLANGRGQTKAGDLVLKGSYSDGLAVGKFVVKSLSDGSSYTTFFNEGIEQIARRSKRKLEPDDEPDEPDEPDDEDDDADKSKQAKTTSDQLED